MRNDIIFGELPNQFIMRDGTVADTIEKWKSRRKEIIEDAIQLEYGGMPPSPDYFELEALNFNGRNSTDSYRVHCGTKQYPFTFCFTVFRADSDEKCPVILTGDSMYRNNCNDRVISEANRRGFIVIKFNRTEFAPDFYSQRNSGIYPMWPELRFSAISAWAWGYLRVVDAIMQLSYADSSKIAITGHSRGGKTVLLAGAVDERIRYVNPNGSGTHGAGCYRFRQCENHGQYEDDTSEPLAFLFANVPYWMGDGMKAYMNHENYIPHDSNFIKSLIAPRCYLETNGYDDIWANPRGAYLSFQAAFETWKLYHQEDNCRTWYRKGGHAHGWEDFNALFDFIETDIKGKPLPDVFITPPYNDMAPLYRWHCPQSI